MNKQKWWRGIYFLEFCYCAVVLVAVAVVAVAVAVMEVTCEVVLEKLHWWVQNLQMDRP